MERVFSIRYEGALFSTNEVEIEALIRSLQGLSDYFKAIQNISGTKELYGDVKIKGTFLFGSFEFFVVMDVELIRMLFTDFASICSIFSFFIGAQPARFDFYKPKNYFNVLKWHNFISRKKTFFKAKKALIEFLSILEQPGAERICINEYSLESERMFQLLASRGQLIPLHGLEKHDGVYISKMDVIYLKTVRSKIKNIIDIHPFLIIASIISMLITYHLIANPLDGFFEIQKSILGYVSAGILGGCIVAFFRKNNS